MTPGDNADVLRRVRTVFLYIALAIAAVVVLFPFAWMLITAFKVPGTEFDPRLKDQREMAELMKNAGLALEVFVFPNTGHWIPADLDKRVDVGLDYIRQGRSGT